MPYYYNEFQKAAIDAYPDEHIKELIEAGVDPEDVGDTLFSFIIRNLGYHDHKDTAIEFMQTVLADVQAVLHAQTELWLPTDA